jgi:hypothetical protein
VVLLTALVAWAGAQQENEDVEYLRRAGIAPDEAGLRKYFKTRSPDEAERARLAALVARLDSNLYPVREKSKHELLAAGENALPFLREVLHKKSLEVTRQAEACIREIEQTPHPQRTAAAARMLARLRPEGGDEVLLEYLPFADWDANEEDLLQALRALGLTEKGEEAVARKAIVQAARDKEPRRRVAVAHVLGFAGPAHRCLLEELAMDANLEVRFHAALALVRHRNDRAVPVLIALVEVSPLPLAFRAEELLRRIALENSPPVPAKLEDPSSRKKWRGDWQAWWDSSRKRLDLAKLDLDDLKLGLTLVCEIDGIGQFPGRITALHRSGTVAWVVEGLDSPTDLQWLGGGRLLVAEHWANRVTERDRNGKILKQWDLKDKPVSCQRLPNGNTFMATYTEITEVSAAGAAVFVHRPAGMTYCACVLANRNVLYITSSGDVIEVDRQGKEVRKFRPSMFADGAAYWSSVEQLANGRYLVSLAGNGKILEVDSAGAIHWQCTIEKGAGATRLTNGNILVASADGRFIVELDRNQKEVWRKNTKGRPFAVRRY